MLCTLPAVLESLQSCLPLASQGNAIQNRSKVALINALALQTWQAFHGTCQNPSDSISPHCSIPSDASCLLDHDYRVMEAKGQLGLYSVGLQSSNNVDIIHMYSPVTYVLYRLSTVYPFKSTVYANFEHSDIGRPNQEDTSCQQARFQFSLHLFQS